MTTIKLNKQATNAIGSKVVEGNQKANEWWIDGDDIWFETDEGLFSTFIGFVDNMEEIFEED